MVALSGELHCPMTTTFRYFAHPHQFSTYREEPAQCNLCGRSRPGYAGPFYGPRDIEFVCEECLATGRLKGLDIATNQGDIDSLREQVRGFHQQLRDDECERLVRDRTAELEHQTPSHITWQDFFWPAHCGDYCCFIKEVGQPELARLAPDGNGPEFLATHASDITDIESAREVWAGIRPDIPLDSHLSYSLGVYLYHCLICSEHVLLWDCD